MKCWADLGITSRKGRFEETGKKPPESSRALNPTRVIPSCFNPAFTQIRYSVRVCGYPRPPSPAALRRDFTHRLVLVLQTAGSHIRHGCRCSGNSGFHSPHAANRLNKPRRPSRNDAGQTCGTEKSNGLPSASGTYAKSDTFRRLRTATRWRLQKVIHPGQGFRGPRKHAPAQYGSKDLYVRRVTKPLLVWC